MKMFKRLVVLGLVLVAVVSPLMARPRADRSAGQAYELVLLHTNDHHGTVLPNNDQGGLAERATFISSVRAANPNVLVVDAGDINTGTALSNMFAAQQDIVAYNMIGYDAVTFGNHEFDGTQEKLLRQIALAEFPFVSSNIMTADGEYLGGHPYLVKQYDGFKIGIIGITTLRAKIIASPDPSLSFINEIDAAREMVDILRNQEQVDVIIALTHIGDHKEDPEHITSPELAQAVPGIDIIVDGHSHSFLERANRVGNTYIVSANEWGKFVGQGKLTIQGGKLAAFQWAPVPITGIAPDPAITAMLEPYIEQANASLKEVVGQASADFIFGDRLTRQIETALGNMICDANVWYFRTVQNQQIDFAFHNGGNMRTELPRGPITQEQILTILPFENYLYVASLKGSDVVALFEFIASIPQGAGGFAQVSREVRYTIDYTGGEGQLRNLTVGGQPVDPNRIYRFCTNDYLLGGGDGYEVLTKAENPYNTSLLLSYVVVEYIRAQRGIITPALDGRITVLGGNPL